MRRRNRIQIVGVSGSGKSTVGRRLAESVGAPYLELDSVYHQPGWVPLPADDLWSRVAPVLELDRWVIDGNYHDLIGREIRERADTMVWLDLPRWLVTFRVLRRSLSRVLRRTELWNGNREDWSTLLSTDPEKNIVLWTWTRYGYYRDLYAPLAAEPGRPDLEVVRLRSGADVERFVAEFG